MKARKLVKRPITKYYRKTKENIAWKIHGKHVYILYCNENHWIMQGREDA